MACIFIVEDEPVIREELTVILQQALYTVAVTDTFSDIPGQIMANGADLLLLDVCLGDCSGIDICKEIRKTSDIPIIFLTARTDSMDELNGILSGGDDYITKPFQVPILLARIAAVLKRAAKGNRERTMTHKGVTLDVSRCSLFYANASVELTKNEMKIMDLLFQNADAYVSRVDLIDYLWENQIFIDDNTLSVHMTRIREKMKTIGIVDFVETGRGLGYRI